MKPSFTAHCLCRDYWQKAPQGIILPGRAKRKRFPSIALIAALAAVGLACILYILR